MSVDGEGQTQPDGGRLQLAGDDVISERATNVRDAGDETNWTWATVFQVYRLAVPGFQGGWTVFQASRVVNSRQDKTGAAVFQADRLIVPGFQGNSLERLCSRFIWW